MPAGPLSPDALAFLGARLTLLGQAGVGYSGIIQQLEAEDAPPEAYLHLPLFLEPDQSAALRALLELRRHRAIPWEVAGRVLRRHGIAPESAVAWETRAPGQAVRGMGVPHWIQTAVRGDTEREKGQGVFRLHGLSQVWRLPDHLVLDRLERCGLRALEALPEQARVLSSVVLDDLPMVTRWPAWLLKHPEKLVVRDCPGLGIPPPAGTLLSLRLDGQPCPSGPMPWGPLRELELNRIAGLTHLPRCLEADSLILTRCPGLTGVPRLLRGHCSREMPHPRDLARHVRIRHCPSLAALPDEADYPAHLALDRCDTLASLGDGLRLGGDLSLIQLPLLRRLPPRLRVPGTLLAKDLPALEDLGEGLVVGGHLVLRNLPRLACFPPGLQVRGDLVLLGCDIVPEPAPDMVVGGSVRLHPRFRDLPWPARVKRNLACEPIEPQPGQWLADPGVSWCGDDFPELYP